MKNEIAAYIAAKAAEDAATEARIKAEEALIALIGDVPDEGSKSVDIDGHKVTLSQRVSRKLDERQWVLIRDEIPEGLSPVSIVETYKLDDAGCRWIRENEPGLWKLLSKAITEKPMKVGVKVQEKK
jgi:hypothetical protein